MRSLVDDLRDAIVRDPDPWDETLYARAAAEIERLRAALTHHGYGTRCGDYGCKCTDCEVGECACGAENTATVGYRHMAHSRMCDCLGHASECCVPRCPCHDDSPTGAVQES